MSNRLSGKVKRDRVKVISDKKIAILGTLGDPLLSYYLYSFIKNGIAIDCVIFDSQRLSMKDLKIWQERTLGKLPGIPLEKFETQFIPFFFVRSHISKITERLIKTRSIDILINGGTPRILTKSVIKAPKIGVINVHPGVLPIFRGCTAVEWAIFLNDKVGNTVHFVNEGIDEGPIILSETYSFLRNDTYSDIRTKVYKKSFGLLVKAVKKVVEQDLRPEKMVPQGSGIYRGVIDEKKIREVYCKLSEGRYKYQI